MTKILPVFLLSTGTVLLSAGWAALGSWQVGLFLIVLLPLALILLKRQFAPTMNLVLLLLSGAAAFGLWKGMNIALAFSGVLCAFAAWDLRSFSERLSFASEEDQPQVIERQHFLRLGLVLSLGLAISLASLFIHVSLSFEWAIGLAVFAFFSIGALANWLRKKEG